jgi:hypothetical protein
MKTGQTAVCSVRCHRGDGNTRRRRTCRSQDPYIIASDYNFGQITAKWMTK